MLVSVDGLALNCKQSTAMGTGEQSKAGRHRVWLLLQVSAGAPLVMLQVLGMHLPQERTVAMGFCELSGSFPFPTARGVQTCLSG